ncbi:MAG: GNAT family N-acetyltransferase [Oscillospiraceae bacterium]|nr:GNAT family N-acetyltransferase [Oscillospiraceae bacterium]
MTEIYLIRHTQAEGNVYHAMQGHWDGDVTALGLRQIDALAERFRDVPLDALYSSDLRRAMLTADALRRYRPLELRTLFDLREINVGPWEARFFADLQWETPELTELFLHRAEEFYLEGAETYGAVRRRAAAALETIARENEGRTVAVVSHGVTIRCLLSVILQKPLDDPTLPICGNTGVTHLYYENGVFRPDYINDCSHLAALNLPEWSRTPNLRSEPVDPEAEAAFYRACYADAWLSAHGTLEHFDAQTYLAAAAEHYRYDRGTVLRFFEGEQSAGLLDLDPRRGRLAGYGWISLLYLDEAHRGQGLGVQLLGRALLYFREKGRRAVRLQAAEDNPAALAFYEKHGFRRLSSETGRFGKLYLMEYRFGESHV